MDHINKLLDFYNQTPEEDLYHKVCGFFLKNIHMVRSSSIYEMADQCFASTATLSRAVKKMGFASYSDFKEKIGYSLEHFQYLNQNVPDMDKEITDIVPQYLEILIQNLQRLEDTVSSARIAEVSACLYKSTKVLIYCTANLHVRNLQKALIVSGKETLFFEETGQAERIIEAAEEGCVLIAVLPDLSDDPKIHVMLKEIREKGGYVILICSGKKSRYDKNADMKIVFEGTRTSIDVYLFVVVINMIIFDYSHQYLEKLT